MLTIFLARRAFSRAMQRSRAAFADAGFLRLTTSDDTTCANLGFLLDQFGPRSRRYRGKRSMLCLRISGAAAAETFPCGPAKKIRR